MVKQFKIMKNTDIHLPPQFDQNPYDSNLHTLQRSTSNSKRETVSMQFNVHINRTQQKEYGVIYHHIISNGGIQDTNMIP